MKTVGATEWLLLEVLVSRRRLGEQIWTFEAFPKIVKTIRKLEAKGYVFSMHGVTENSIRAGLTDEGAERFMSPDYVPPILREAGVS